MKYAKPPLPIPEQIELLKQRGMQIADDGLAAHYLAHLNYYRLAAYWLPFEQDHASHQFKPGTTFDQVLDLYIFDRELRLLVLDAVERAEVSLRGRMASHLSCKYGAHAHLRSDLYANHRTYSYLTGKLHDEIDRSGEEFIRHLTNKYDEALPPLWASVEVMSFGHLSQWYKNLKLREDRKVIADNYDIDEKFLCSFFHHLSIVRNICAHHARLWNREFTFTYKLPSRRPSALTANLNYSAPRKLYNTLAMLAHLMDVTCIEHHWKTRLLTLLQKHHVDTRAMGFPADYASRPLWRVDGVSA
ncbi:Abi family protein [Mariprofundus erugo]|nr:Abi family protein [Mariprofundus erugo]